VTAITDDLLGRMTRRIVDAVDPEQVILFGSRARGDHRDRSDVDLIVIEAEPFGSERSRHGEMLRLYEALRDLEALEIMDCRGSDEIFGFHVQQAAEKG